MFRPKQLRLSLLQKSRRIGMHVSRKDTPEDLDTKEESDPSRKISFADESTNEIHTVPSIDDIEEVMGLWEELWYSFEELEEIGHDCQMQLVRKRLGRFHESNTETMRGLDGLVDPALIKKRSCFMKAFQSEQDRQKRRGLCDVNRLAKVSTSRSKKSTMAALKRGINDAKAVAEDTLMQKRSMVMKT